MSEKVYKLFIGDPKEAWYQLSEKEQNKLLEKNRMALEKVGGKAVKYYDCYWSSESWVMFGIEEFPSVEAEQAYAKAQVEIKWPRYMKANVYLGTEADM